MVSEKPQDVSVGEYTWPEIDGLDDYDRLVGILDVGFEGEAIARELKSNSSSEVSDVLVEYDYIDKDCRSTAYKCCSKMGRP